MIQRNPVSVAQPVANYSHQIEVADTGRWLVLSGQLGQDLAGRTPEDPIEQIELALANLGHNLDAAGMEIGHVVKLTIYLVGEIDPARRRAALDTWLAGHRPCMTLLYVSALAAPAFRVELDAWAHAEQTDPRATPERNPR